MNVNECMTKDVKVCAPTSTIRDAAATMKQIDSGILPVAENDRMIGMITDRDIAIRAVAENRGPDTPVREAMTQEVLYCFDDQDVEEVARQMSKLQVRRMPVVSRDKRLVGMISLGDIAKADDDEAGEALKGVTQPGGRHVQ
ncbi:MAG: CBS domain-containing protein [Tistlia sp.]|uniref:CBS domain-containing protein n=1 Tax=Tistlia sp. TaxID=3057121 RepID=UPI0034A1306D